MKYLFAILISISSFAYAELLPAKKVLAANRDASTKSEMEKLRMALEYVEDKISKKLGVAGETHVDIYLYIDEEWPKTSRIIEKDDAVFNFVKKTLIAKGYFIIKQPGLLNIYWDEDEYNKKIDEQSIKVIENLIRQDSPAQGSAVISWAHSAGLMIPGANYLEIVNKYKGREHWIEEPDCYGCFRVYH
jgi:hypothetical protein